MGDSRYKKPLPPARKKCGPFPHLEARKNRGRAPVQDRDAPRHPLQALASP
ncbi:hypothetical protein ASNO1_51160 [Corallococcus caeni]|uniref:Uncharacterized protein n=1 Tax=Corallococcus caeni TaxID=3082388 RepID=A0ABQ6R051_9BACT|nr:hypothetical protein ASNO1_51160 [Corallococcus sp. NO1]